MLDTCYRNQTGKKIQHTKKIQPSKTKRFPSHTINYREEWEDEALELAQEKTQGLEGIEINNYAVVNDCDDYGSDYIYVPAFVLIHKTEMKTTL